MQIKIEPSWQKVLESEFSKPYFTDLVAFVKNEYANHTVFPAGKNIFAAFDHTPFDNVNVVLIGQDPYHGEGQANGLCFSVNENTKLPPSLKNIFKEIANDLGKESPKNGNLERWAKQGILMLNATLTVRANNPGSHQKKGWENFTDAVISILSEQKKDIVFILWGAYAQKKGEIIDKTKHFVIESAHPSPFSADRGFFGSKPFSKTNQFLLQKKLKQIDW